MRTPCAVLLGLFATTLLATEAKVVGDQLILSGRASGNELALVRDAIAEHGDRIKTVILRDHSGRAENTDLMRAADLFAERGWRTAVSGFCGTACSKLFLGGVERQFTDDKPAAQTSVMFGSTTFIKDSFSVKTDRSRLQGEGSERHNFEVRQWFKSRTGDKISEAALDRLFIPDGSVRYLHFYDSKRLGRKDGVSVLYCDGKEAPAKRWADCEKVADLDAYREGIVTSSDLIRSNDRPSATRAGPAATQSDPAK
jgi:hypothetical protein